MKRTHEINVFNKKIGVEIRGDSEIPLLVVGPASLFKKNGLLPEDLYQHFSVYFVDFFEAVEGSSLNYNALTLDDFIDAIEQIRQQLDLPRIALLAHSSNGVLAMEYANKHNEHVIFNVLIGTMPIWGDSRKKINASFFQFNASEKRKTIERNNAMISSAPGFFSSPAEKFIEQYKARKAQFFGDDNLIHSLSDIDHLWDEIALDMELVNQYFSVIANYDMRVSQYKPIPTFIGLGLYDASCPFYVWTDEIKEWFLEKNQLELYDEYIKLYIFDSDHYPMSPVFHQAKPALFVDKLVEYMQPFLIQEAAMRHSEELSEESSMWQGSAEVHALNQRLDQLVAYGTYLLSCDVEKGKLTMLHGLALKKELKDFFELSAAEQTQELPAFKASFLIQLHSQDAHMGVHREEWKVIIANIAIALTGFGLIALGIHYAATGQCFFASTQRQKLVERVAEDHWLVPR